MNKYQILILVIIMLMVTGCKKCVESHKENSTCYYFRCSEIGDMTICHQIPYSCEKTVCDRYEEIK